MPAPRSDDGAARRHQETLQRLQLAKFRDEARRAKVLESLPSATWSERIAAFAVRTCARFVPAAQAVPAARIAVRVCALAMVPAVYLGVQSMVVGLTSCGFTLYARTAMDNSRETMRSLTGSLTGRLSAHAAVEAVRSFPARANVYLSTVERKLSRRLVGTETGADGVASSTRLRQRVTGTLQFIQQQEQKMRGGAARSQAPLPAAAAAEAAGDALDLCGA